jgi:hypothetical protein
VQWTVKYAPGNIEARDSKGGKLTLTDKRETTPAKVVITTRRGSRRPYVE